MDTAPSLRDKLSHQQCQAYERLARSVVDRTLNEYIQQLETGLSPSFDKKTWKMIKSRENVRIFKARGRRQIINFVESVVDEAPRLGLARWTPYASLRCVGNLHGSLEDAMYGTITPTQRDMATRSAILQDEFVQHRVLQDIQTPEVDAPFEYVGLKWARRASRVATIVRARDLIYVEATGIRTVKVDGRDERVGYAVYHSVEPREVVPPKRKGAVLARYSLCVLYREKSPSLTEVYASLASDPGGNMLPRLAAMSAASALITCAGIMRCAMIKKISSRVLVSEGLIGQTTRVAVVKMKGVHVYCAQCTRNVSSIGSLDACNACGSTVCHRCMVTCKLVVQETIDTVSLQSANICKSCIANSHNVSGAQIAAEEFVVRRIRRENALDGTPTGTFRMSESVPRARRSLTVLCPDGSLVDTSSSFTTLRESEDSLAQTYFRFAKHSSISSSNPDLLSDRMDILELNSSPVDGNCSGLPLEDKVDLVDSMPVSENHNERLLRRMNHLNILADQTYYFTKQQSRSFDYINLMD